MQRDPESHVTEKAYAHRAPVYDVLGGPVFLNGRRAAALAARARRRDRPKHGARYRDRS